MTAVESVSIASNCAGVPRAAVSKKSNCGLWERIVWSISFFAGSRKPAPLLMNSATVAALRPFGRCAFARLGSAASIDFTAATSPPATAFRKSAVTSADSGNATMMRSARREAIRMMKSSAAQGTHECFAAHVPLGAAPGA